MRARQDARLLVWSFLGAGFLLALGVALNRAFDADVNLFFPGSAIINRIVPFSTYPTSLKIGMVLLNLVIWAGLVYAVASLATSRRKQLN